MRQSSTVWFWAKFNLFRSAIPQSEAARVQVFKAGDAEWFSNCVIWNKCTTPYYGAIIYFCPPIVSMQWVTSQKTYCKIVNLNVSPSSQLSLKRILKLSLKRQNQFLILQYQNFDRSNCENAKEDVVACKSSTFPFLHARSNLSPWCRTVS